MALIASCNSTDVLSGSISCFSAADKRSSSSSILGFYELRALGQTGEGLEAVMAVMHGHQEFIVDFAASPFAATLACLSAGGTLPVLASKDVAAGDAAASVAQAQDSAAEPGETPLRQDQLLLKGQQQQTQQQQLQMFHLLAQQGSARKNGNTSSNPKQLQVQRQQQTHQQLQLQKTAAGGTLRRDSQEAADVEGAADATADLNTQTAAAATAKAAADTAAVTAAEDDAESNRAFSGEARMPAAAATPSVLLLLFFACCRMHATSAYACGLSCLYHARSICCRWLNKGTSASFRWS